MRLTISVTENDIALAIQDKRMKRGNCGNCPIARAIQRVIEVCPEMSTVGVCDYETTIAYRVLFLRKDNRLWTGQKSCRSAILPREAMDFVDDFDKGHKVVPFTFTLAL